MKESTRGNEPTEMAPEMQRAHKLAQDLILECYELGANVTVVVTSKEDDEVLLCASGHSHLDYKEQVEKIALRLLCGLRKLSVAFGLQLEPALLEEVLEERIRRCAEPTINV